MTHDIRWSGQKVGVYEIVDAPLIFKSDHKGEKVMDRPKTICGHRYFSSHMITFKVNAVK